MPSVIPGFQKTWTISANNAFTTGGVSNFQDTTNMLVVFFNWLLANGWTCGGSGTGTGGAYAFGAHGTPSVSLLVGSGSFGNGSGGNAWIRLMNATMGIEVLVQQASGTGSAIFAWYASYAGFTGGAPSATVAPTATDAFTCNTQAGATGYPFWNTGTFSGKYHTWKSSDGYVNHFILYINSIPVFHFHSEKPTNAIAGLPSAIIGVFDDNNGGAGADNNMCQIGAWLTHAWYHTYFASAAQNLNGAIITINTTTARSIAAACLLDGNWSITPVGCGNTSGSYAGFYFWFADLWTVATVLQEGCLMPSTAPYQVVVVGDLLLPWLNNSTPMQVT